MKIPKTIDLLNHTITVVKRKNLYDEADCYGRWTQSDMKIEIDTGHACPSLQWHSFWHEVTHAVLDLCGYPDLSKDEKLVDSFGGGLAQIIKFDRRS